MLLAVAERPFTHMLRPPVPMEEPVRVRASWVVVIDPEGRWCVESRLGWPCRVCLSIGRTHQNRVEAEAHAHEMARALNRIYDPR